MQKNDGIVSCSTSQANRIIEVYFQILRGMLLNLLHAMSVIFICCCNCKGHFGWIPLRCPLQFQQYIIKYYTHSMKEIQFTTQLCRRKKKLKNNLNKFVMYHALPLVQGSWPLKKVETVYFYSLDSQLGTFLASFQTKCFAVNNKRNQSKIKGKNVLSSKQLMTSFRSIKIKMYKWGLTL